MQQRIQLSHAVMAGMRMICVVLTVASITLAIAGCANSKEAAAKEDAQGKEVNDQAVKRMVSEQTGKMATPGGGK